MTPEEREMCEAVGEWAELWKRGKPCLGRVSADWINTSQGNWREGTLWLCRCEQTFTAVPYKSCPEHDIPAPNFLTPEGHERLKARLRKMEISYRLDWSSIPGRFYAEVNEGRSPYRCRAEQHANSDQLALLKACAALAKREAK